MRNIGLIIAATAVLFAAAPLRAQGPAEFEEDMELAPPPEHFMTPPPPGEHPPLEPPPGFDAEAPEGMPGCPPPGEPPRHVERWLERLQARSPGEFERLQTLRRDDPEAFRRALVQRLSKERMKGGWHRGGPGRISSPEIDRLEKESREMGRAYRAAATAEEKTAIRDDLRAKLEALFDLRERERAQHIAEIEKHLAELKGALEGRAARRDQIIGHRLLQLTEGEGLAW
ncbi:MAG: hypothetical protein JXB04_04525 [Kiritimatiellae bacterium]|nr:hypothetical protein [Kiritimatiellia bacterium]